MQLNNTANLKTNHYLGNPNIKRAGVKEEWTKETLREYNKCKNDVSYFLRTYAKVIHIDKGKVNFELYPYQEKMMNQFNENRFNIVLACRQSGKTIGVAGYLLHYAIFNADQDVVITANKADTTREILSRIILMLENLPFFLQAGCKELNKGSIQFDNDSKIRTGSSGSGAVRGKSASLLYIDEFAFVQDDVGFYTSTYPIVSAGETSKIIITSTTNGLGNMFHKIYTNAVAGKNEYKPLRVDWWDVPGRDEKWKAMTIANTSEMQFKQEFMNEFMGSSDTLINGNAILKMKAETPKEFKENGKMRIYKEPGNGKYLLFCDVAHGRGLDYSSFNIIDVTTKPFKQVAVFQCNDISPLLLPDIIYKYAIKYNNAFVVVENNDQGSVVCNKLYYDLDYEHMYLSSMVKSDAIGVRMTTKVKSIGCSHMKDLLENDQLEIVDEETINEISTFCAKGKSYEASGSNHDDLVMNLVLMGWFSGTSMFEDITKYTIEEVLWRERERMEESDIPPVGIMSDDLIPDNAVFRDNSGDIWEEA